MKGRWPGLRLLTLGLVGVLFRGGLGLICGLIPVPCFIRPLRCSLVGYDGRVDMWALGVMVYKIV